MTSSKLDWQVENKPFAQTLFLTLALLTSKSDSQESVCVCVCACICLTDQVSSHVFINSVTCRHDGDSWWDLFCWNIMFSTHTSSFSVPSCSSSGMLLNLGLFNVSVIDYINLWSPQLFSSADWHVGPLSWHLINVTARGAIICKLLLNWPKIWKLPTLSRLAES